jgi:hypothetical protein
MKGVNLSEKARAREGFLIKKIGEIPASKSQNHAE